MSFESQIKNMEAIAVSIRTEKDPKKVAAAIKSNALKDEKGNILAPYLAVFYHYLVNETDAELRTKSGGLTARTNRVLEKLYKAITDSRQYLNK